LRYRYQYDDNNIYDSSIVASNDDRIAFFCASQRDIARFDVVGWDDDKIHCSFGTARPYTILESMARSFGPDNQAFVRGQKLYVKEGQQLMVFDVCSYNRIRKLGHFYRMDCYIEDVAVLEDGRLILCALWNKWERRFGKMRRDRTRYLYLLENPQ
jgi:hypothetical protein